MLTSCVFDTKRTTVPHRHTNLFTDVTRARTFVYSRSTAVPLLVHDNVRPFYFNTWFKYIILITTLFCFCELYGMSRLYLHVKHELQTPREYTEYLQEYVIVVCNDVPVYVDGCTLWMPWCCCNRTRLYRCASARAAISIKCWRFMFDSCKCLQIGFECKLNATRNQLLCSC